MRHSACLRRSIEYCFLYSQPTASDNEMGYFKVFLVTYSFATALASRKTAERVSGGEASDA